MADQLSELIAPLDLDAWEARLDDRASVAVPLVRALIQRLREAEILVDRFREQMLSGWAEDDREAQILPIPHTHDPDPEMPNHIHIRGVPPRLHRAGLPQQEVGFSGLPEWFYRPGPFQVGIALLAGAAVFCGLLFVAGFGR